MRNITINIYPRTNTGNNYFNFGTLQSGLIPVGSLEYTTTGNDVSNIYAFNSMKINYSLFSSDITSVLTLTMNVPETPSNILRSGQPIIITDNGSTIFEGVVLTPNYNVLKVNKDSRSNVVVTLILAPSILQLTKLPMLFDVEQKNQIDGLLGIDTAIILAANVTQQVGTEDLLNYMVSNTDLQDFFNKAITYSGLPDEIYLMAQAGQVRDSVLRISIDFTNTVFYQQEDGECIIRQLDATIKTPFIIDPTNSTQFDLFPAILEHTYIDGAANTLAVVSNYNILSPGVGISTNANANYLSYAPNPEFYPRVQELQNTGWFSGSIEHTPINNNIVNNPSLAPFLNGLQTTPNQYMVSSDQYGASQNFIAAYQALITAKMMGAALVNYQNLMCTISLDDPYLTTDTSLILGTCVDIINSDMKAGLIATYSRDYSLAGSFITLNLVPLGSCTGYWVN